MEIRNYGNYCKGVLKRIKKIYYGIARKLKNWKNGRNPED